MTSTEAVLAQFGGRRSDTLETKTEERETRCEKGGPAVRPRCGFKSRTRKRRAAYTPSGTRTIGKSTVNVGPVPTPSLITSTRPPCALTS